MAAPGATSQYQEPALLPTPNPTPNSRGHLARSVAGMRAFAEGGGPDLLARIGGRRDRGMQAGGKFRSYAATAAAPPMPSTSPASRSPA